MNSFQITIGLEVHAQLNTKSKLFCGCDARHQCALPNTNICTVCTGLPGTLPVMNKKAVEQTIIAGLALNSQISTSTKWDRKNYHYPDLPKGYQISQYDNPLAYAGYLNIQTQNTQRAIGIRSIHLEEDTASLYHTKECALVDYNRSGVPLIEIVSKPDIRSSEEAKNYLQHLQRILRYLGVSTCDMQSGAFRVDANVSLSIPEQKKLGIKVEIKNLNSFRHVKQAIDYEVNRQISVLEKGETITSETRGWNAEKGITFFQRLKEQTNAYRYFADPDLPVLDIADEWICHLRSYIPELPYQKLNRFQSEYALSYEDADLLTTERATADWYEEAIQIANRTPIHIPPKTIANWVITEVFKIMSKTNLTITALPLKPHHLIQVLSLVINGELNHNTAKYVLIEIARTGKPVETIIETEGLKQVSQPEQLDKVVTQVIDRYPNQVKDYLEGKSKIAKWLMGQIMKNTEGKGNPRIVRELLLEQLKAADF